MHQHLATAGTTSPTRWCVATHAAARDTGGHAVATIDRGTSIRLAPVPHFRTSAIPATWPARRAVGDQPGHHGLQLETHAERAGRKPAPSGSRRIGKCHPCATTSQNKKRCSEFQNIASSTSCPCFVTDWRGPGLGASFFFFFGGGACPRVLSRRPLFP